MASATVNGARRGRGRRSRPRRSGRRRGRGPEVGEVADAAGGDHLGRRSRRRSAFSSSSAGPSIVPSTSIGVKRKRSTPRAVSSATASAASTSPGLGPARERDLAAAGVDRDDDPLAVALQRRVEERPGRAAPRCRSRPAPRRPRAPRRPTSASRSPPPTWIGHSTAAAIRRTASRFCGVARLGAVEVDDVQELGPFAGPARRRVDRVGVVGGLALVVALQQPHRLAAADVDRRVEDHAGDGAWRRSRRSWRAAAGRRRSTSRGGTGRRRRCRARPRRRSARRRRRCRAARRARAAARRSGRSRRASRSRSPRSGATRAPSAPATSRCAGP